jgi:hypothetical protein
MEQLTRMFMNIKVDIYKKYIETFANGIYVYAFYTKKEPTPEQI